MASSGRIYHAVPSTTSPIGGTAASIGRVRDRTERRVAERLLASRVADGRGRGHHGPLTFDHLAAWYLDDYLVRRLRTVDTARGRVANLRATFGGQPATVMTTEAIRSYQWTRLAAGAVAATVNRETSALSRMLQLAIRAGALDHRPVFPERLEERGPRQGSFEHADYEAVRRHLPPAYQDVLDFAYYSGWRKREILELRWSEVAEGGGVVRLSPERSKTRVGRVLPIVPPIAAVLARRRAQRQGEDPVVFRRDAARNLVRAGVPERVAMQLTGHRSRAVFDRYNIVREDELHQAGARLVAYVAAQAAREPSPAFRATSAAGASARHPRPPLAHGVAHRLSGGRGADPLPSRLPAHRRAQPDPRERPRAGRHAPDRAQEPRHLRPLQHHPRAGIARRRGPARRVSGAAGAGSASPSAAPHDRHRRPAPSAGPPPRATHHRVRAGSRCGKPDVLIRGHTRVRTGDVACNQAVSLSARLKTSGAPDRRDDLPGCEGHVPMAAEVRLQAPCIKTYEFRFQD